MEKGVYKVFSIIMGIAVEEIDEESSPDTIETWESISHMKLIAGLEEEFDIEFEEDEIVEMLNIEQILSVIKRKTIKN